GDGVRARFPPPTCAFGGGLILETLTKRGFKSRRGRRDADDMTASAKPIGISPPEIEPCWQGAGYIGYDGVSPLPDDGEDAIVPRRDDFT
ncbi:MAG: hypothetical protein NZ843_03375, partial [Fimbriimonadales bacterium]|nr:hypothetical protein [Fimbriimonadales bacterium]